MASSHAREENASRCLPMASHSLLNMWKVASKDRPDDDNMLSRVNCSKLLTNDVNGGYKFVIPNVV